MSEEFSPELRKELLDDFYAECDELLTGAREALTALDLNVDADQSDQVSAQSLFRCVHTLKGSAAMVGLRPAEALAHGMEDVLRRDVTTATSLDRTTIDLLMAVLQRFEQVVAAHRDQRTLPDVDELLTRLRSATGVPPTGTSARPKESLPSTPPAPAIATAADIRARGLQPWTASFAPSAELHARGVNIDAVRSRLATLGEIVSVTPQVRGKGVIVFEFLLALKNPPADLSAWEKDGVGFTPPAPAATATAEVATDAMIATLTPSHVVRVDLARLDDLMRIGGEMVILRSRLEDRLNQPDSADELREINRGLTRALRDLRQAIARVRLVPIAEIFTRMPYAVRDLAQHAPQKARVVLEGRQTEIDKYLVERLREPLLHLVRNAFSHGIEPPAARKAAGKPPEGTIVLRATQVGEFIELKIRDDGRGVDFGAVAARARLRGIPVSEQLDADNVVTLLCAPGFSTRDEADLTSGRGVGMAVVATTVRELGGTLTLTTTLGAGAEFTLRVPLMLSIIPAILVAVADQRCAVPQGFVEEIIQVPADTMRTIKRTEVVPYRGGLLPVVRLRAIFGRPPAAEPSLTLLVLKSDRGTVGLLVDNVHAQREVVVRPLADPLVQVPYISGATELGDGRPILVLDPVAITSGVVRPAGNLESNKETLLSGARPS